MLAVTEAQRIWRTIPARNGAWREHVESLPYSAMDKAGIMEKLQIAWAGRNGAVIYMGMTAETLYRDDAE